MKNLKLRRVISIMNDSAEDSIHEIEVLYRSQLLSNHQRTMLESLMVSFSGINELAESFMHTHFLLKRMGMTKEKTIMILEDIEGRIENAQVEMRIAYKMLDDATAKMHILSELVFGHLKYLREERND